MVCHGIYWYTSSRVRRTDREGADLLRDARRFRPRDLGRSKRVEESGLSVIHVSHHAHHRRSWREAVERRLCYGCSTQFAAQNGETRGRDGMGWDTCDGIGRGWMS